MGNMTGSTQTGGISLMNTDVWMEMLDNEELLHEQYDIVAGNWPKAYNEVVLIVDKNNELVDYALYALGIKNQTELMQMMQEMMQGKELEKQQTIAGPVVDSNPTKVMTGVFSFVYAPKKEEQ